MDVPMAELILAQCKVEKLDKLYENPKDDVLCSCSYCKAHPPALKKTVCNCSGCHPEAENSMETEVKDEGLITVKPKEKPLKKQCLTKLRRERATKWLIEWRYSVWDKADEASCGWLPPDVFLPEPTMKNLLDHFYNIRTIDNLLPHIWHIKLISREGEDLLKALLAMHQELEELQLKHRQGLREARALQAWEEEAEVLDSDSEASGVEEPMIRWRINHL
ncbi:hypothetical protein BV22DRAFT_1134850 [Leucogyrophana mollusca]|uniref:Uncharacterized protein n=1 Tax=Leucogyrophana mollusca TaxID=85980 RepID=A0ACB8AXK4_9AGAM|nr:hypothetical protein BV22DRAFT_1134850 [Leucogyrophana mollusca]